MSIVSTPAALNNLSDKCILSNVITITSFINKHVARQNEIGRGLHAGGGDSDSGREHGRGRGLADAHANSEHARGGERDSGGA